MTRFASGGLVGFAFAAFVFAMAVMGGALG